MIDSLDECLRLLGPPKEFNDHGKLVRQLRAYLEQPEITRCAMRPTILATLDRLQTATPLPTKPKGANK